MSSSPSRAFMAGAAGDADPALTRPGADASVRLGDVARTVDDYVHDYPWLAVVAGVVVAGTIGFIAGSAIAMRRESVRPWD